jgi:hypothetical protein
MLPLSSGYKGFPLCQAKEVCRAAQRLESHLASSLSAYGTTAKQRIASICRARVRTDKLQPVIDAA